MSQARGLCPISDPQGLNRQLEWVCAVLRFVGATSSVSAEVVLLVFQTSHSRGWSIHGNSTLCRSVLNTAAVRSF